MAFRRARFGKAGRHGRLFGQACAATCASAAGASRCPYRPAHFSIFIVLPGAHSRSRAFSPPRLQGMPQSKKGRAHALPLHHFSICFAVSSLADRMENVQFQFLILVIGIFQNCSQNAMQQFFIDFPCRHLITNVFCNLKKMLCNGHISVNQQELRRQGNCQSFIPVCKTMELTSAIK